MKLNLQLGGSAAHCQCVVRRYRESASISASAGPSISIFSTSISASDRRKMSISSISISTSAEASIFIFRSCLSFQLFKNDLLQNPFGIPMNHPLTLQLYKMAGQSNSDSSMKHFPPVKRPPVLLFNVTDTHSINQLIWLQTFADKYCKCQTQLIWLHLKRQKPWKPVSAILCIFHQHL